MKSLRGVEGVLLGAIMLAMSFAYAFNVAVRELAPSCAPRLAWMGQQDNLLPWLTVLGNVGLGARLRGEPLDRDRAEALLARVGLIPQRDQRPATLSGGQRQRAALARTLMEDRPVVLMDEPFSALDAITRARLQVLAAQLLAGRTVLLVTHDPLEALRLGHRIHVMAGQPARIEPPNSATGIAPVAPSRWSRSTPTAWVCHSSSRTQPVSALASLNRAPESSCRTAASASASSPAILPSTDRTVARRTPCPPHSSRRAIGSPW